MSAREHPSANGQMPLAHESSALRASALGGYQPNTTLDQILEQAQTAIFAFNRDYQLLYLNQSSERILGQSRNDVVGRHLKDLLPPDLFSIYKTNSDQILRSRTAATFIEPIQCADGVRRFESHKFPLFDEQGNLIAIGCISTDVEAKLRAQNELELERSHTLHAAKLAWLADMASGISHEINNPLTVILGMAGRLRENASRGFIDAQTVQSTSDKIERMVQRISFVVTSLRDISRDADADPFMPVQLRWIVDRALALSLSNATLGSAAVCLDEIPEQLNIECRHIQITQVLVHLLLNARDAIREAREKWLKLNFNDLGSEIELHVTDSGSGIPREFREKIFDPFFSTKDATQSSGLGLTMARRMCEIHGGRLSLATETEQTTFIVRLPKRQSRRI